MYNIYIYNYHKLDIYIGILLKKKHKKHAVVIVYVMYPFNINPCEMGL